MKLGDKGQDVIDVQLYLIQKGFLKRGEGHDIVPPEYNYGVLTKKAVMKVQERLDLEKTGEWDDQLKTLLEIAKIDYQKKVEAESDPAPMKLFRLQPRTPDNPEDTNDPSTEVPPEVEDEVEEPKEEETIQATIENIPGTDYSRYTIGTGDTLYDVCFKQLGDSSRMEEVMELNNLTSEVLEPGKTLILPPKKAVEGSEENLEQQQIIDGEAGEFTKKTHRKGVKFTEHEIECYIINLNTGTKIEFGIAPENVSDSNSAQYEDEQTRGRSSPFKGYVGSGPRDMNFTINLCQDYCPMGIVQTERLMRALVYPHKSSVLKSPKCLFHLGDFINVVGVPMSVNSEWRKPFKDGVYSFCDVSFSLNEVEEISRTTSEVEQNG